MAKCYSSDKESKSTDQVSTLAFKAAKMIRYSCLGKFIATKKTSNFFFTLLSATSACTYTLTRVAVRFFVCKQRVVLRWLSSVLSFSGGKIHSLQYILNNGLQH